MFKSSIFLPPLLVCVLAFVIILYPTAPQCALAPTPTRYSQAKSKLNDLCKTSTQNKFREPWEQLAKEFLNIYQTDPKWPNRPAALFRAAEVYEELAKRSFNNQ
ncbi:MAG: hypothetical protein IJT59_05390, partial [Desulfovibrionaceae bacterium]|nr:hypothetical protein [Desulfovibrionaceae bacterium]